MRPTQNAQTDDSWRHYYALFQRWIHRLDARSLEQVFNEAISLYSLELVAKKLLLPLYQQLWQQQDVLPSTHTDYAFLHEFLCAKLGARYLQQNSRATGKHILLANIQGHEAQLASLLLANVLSQHGYQVSLLGTNIQLDHLPLIIGRATFDALLLPQSNSISAALHTLVNMTNIHVFLSAPQEGQTPEMPETPKHELIHWLPSDLSDVCHFMDQTLPTSNKTP